MTMDGVAAAVSRSEAFRPAIPKWWPPDVVQLLSRCWAGDPAARPEFAEVRTELDRHTLQISDSPARGGGGGGLATGEDSDDYAGMVQKERARDEQEKKRMADEARRAAASHVSKRSAKDVITVSSSSSAGRTRFAHSRHQAPIIASSRRPAKRNNAASSPTSGSGAPAHAAVTSAPQKRTQPSVASGLCKTSPGKLLNSTVASDAGRVHRVRFSFA